MNLIKKADVKNHLSARRKKIVFPFGPASQPDATGYSRDELRDANVNASRPGDPVDTSTAKKAQS